MFRYVIPIIPPSLNRFAGRNNAWEYRKLKQEWKDIVAAYCRPKPEVRLDKVKVILRYFFSTKVRRDPDNYAGKMILDGLVECGILRDDSFGNIALVLEGNYDKDNPRTEILIESVECDIKNIGEFFKSHLCEEIEDLKVSVLM